MAAKKSTSRDGKFVSQPGEVVIEKKGKPAPNPATKKKGASRGK